MPDYPYIEDGDYHSYYSYRVHYLDDSTDCFESVNQSVISATSISRYNISQWRYYR